MQAKCAETCGKRNVPFRPTGVYSEWLVLLEDPKQPALSACYRKESLCLNMACNRLHNAPHERISQVPGYAVDLRRHVCVITHSRLADVLGERKHHRENAEPVSRRQAMPHPQFGGREMRRRRDIFESLKERIVTGRNAGQGTSIDWTATVRRRQTIERTGCQRFLNKPVDLVIHCGSCLCRTLRKKGVGDARAKRRRSSASLFRVEPGDYSPGPPTDPDVKISLIRFLSNCCPATAAEAKRRHAELA